MPRRRSRYSTPGPRAGSVLLDTGRRGARRRRRRRRGGGGVGWGRLAGRLLVVLAVLGAAAGGVYLWRSHENAADARRTAAEHFAAAWQGRDPAAMWRALSPRARAITPERRFVTAYRNADRAAGVRAVKAGTLGPERDGRIALPVAVRTDIFGTLRGTIRLPVSGTGDDAGVDWSFALRLPGLRSDEAVVRRAGPDPRRGALLAADGSRLEGTALATRPRRSATPTGSQAIRPRGWCSGSGSSPARAPSRAARSAPRSTPRCRRRRRPRSATRSAASR